MASWNPGARGCCCCESDRLLRWAAAHHIIYSERCAPLEAVSEIIAYVEACETKLADANIALPPKSGGYQLAPLPTPDDFLSVGEILRRRREEKTEEMSHYRDPEGH